MYDELDLDMLGDERTALFLIMSDTDGTFAFLISLIYSILFNRLCERADDVYGGRLPIHVRCLIDEAANIGQIPNLERLMATIRSREISACLVLQAQSQLKALYKDNMDTIIGNCDASLFLGGKEETTLKSWNSLLGKETIDLYNTSVTKGNQESHGQNFQKLGKDLMSVDELAVMDGGKCLLQIRGVRPFLSRKYDITKHPNYKLLSDFNEKNAFNIIYADPPWHYDRKHGSGVAENHYPTMSIEEICALPVSELAAKDSALFLWATFPQLNEAFRVIDAWGFKYKTLAFLWLKQNRKADSWFYGMGFWTRSNAEVCLLATRGRPKRQCAGIHQFVISHIEQHSKKPDEVRDKIVKLMGDQPRVELFARQKTPGWDVWGNEVNCTLTMPERKG